jgi:hypothetical protein
MRTERSFSTPLIAGSALLVALILFVLWVVPLVACPRCIGFDPVATSPATGFICPLCLGKKKVSWLKQVRWRMAAEQSLKGAH